MVSEEKEGPDTSWYRTWFDTVYYHSLYQHRDDVEAQEFLIHLLEELNVPKGAKVMDLACGKGRHSITMHEAGLDVVGLDLSENSIAHLQDKVVPGLAFFQWDMREPYKEKAFDFIFNLFTSFGYFNEIRDNLKVLESVHFGLKDDGVFVMDYLNAAPLVDITSVKEERIERDGYTFRTSKKISGSQVVKSIDVEDGGETHHFEERVQLFVLSDMALMMREAGLRVKQVYGSYALDAYDEQVSDRMIIIAEKA